MRRSTYALAAIILLALAEFFQDEEGHYEQLLDEQDAPWPLGWTPADDRVLS